MANPTRSDPVLRKLAQPLALTRAGLLAEQALRAFWPLMTVAMAALAALMLGLQDHLPIELVWGGFVIGVLGLIVTFALGIRRFQWPTRTDALARLDATLPGRPIAAILDRQAIGAGDADSVALWQAHQARMAQRAAGARPARPDLRLAPRDPYALRYVALLALLVALLFGSVWRVGTVAGMVPGGGTGLASGPTWEGWIEPPRYTGKPTLYLSDLNKPDLSVPESSRIILRFYGEVGALTLAETVSGRTGEDAAIPSAADPQQEFTVERDGELRISGPGGRKWSIDVIKDIPPEIAVAGPASAEASGEMTLPFSASDDYGVTGGQAVIALDLEMIDRRFGLIPDPEPRENITVPLPLPITGDRAEFGETLVENFSQHPWANLPVTITLTANDAAGHVTATAPFATPLPARRFFDPMAAAVIEQRRDLLWSQANAPRVAQILRAVSHRPEDIFRSQTTYLRLRVILRRLETFTHHGLDKAHRDEIAAALWDLAVLLEEGDLGDALERLRRAQERLSEAMKNGASDQEIADLMQELRDATQDYLRQLAQQQPQEGDEQQNAENSIQMGQDDLQRMMDRIQELMEQGRMAEAQQALQELQQMMDNMRVTQGQGGPSEGQQAMEGLAETLREQQGLSDQAFRDLQDRFGPNGAPGRDGQQDQEQTLADRQRALRDELARQQGQLPAQGSPEGDAAGRALERAGRAMDDAETALREDDYAGAIDRQSEAMEALREGMRDLGEALAQNRRTQPGEGETGAGSRRADGRDPLGRETGQRGSVGTDQGLLQGEDIYRRARELLDEIRRRSGEGERSKTERDYLQRLLERF
ncbi:TIGR02302 family protein [Pontibaca salina]|uniref:TIGR02302 family protein n=1 Tax=Pontibaca salina TaxID=2795731 RepID=A0A934LXK3_9RHOB|nr:TIGR02302 family protein [Pontibaca salina]MBI6628722.1 TIGR02302 family protein [Pontibaca salina]